ncbi:MAG: hypothetical protein Tsb005_12010 [Gammaproteobacteria bacterium]
MNNLPFNIIAGATYGITHSSLIRNGELIPAIAMGQAAIDLYVNAATGNLVVEDKLILDRERFGRLELGFCYNSQIDQNSWQWTLKKIDLSKSKHNYLLLVEQDGAQLICPLDTSLNIYKVPACGNGQARITKINNDQQFGWVYFDPAIGVKEYFNHKGQLVKKVSRKGNYLIYFYEADQLTKIMTETERFYTIETMQVHADRYIYVFMNEGGIKTLLHRYEFDHINRLTKTIIQQNYAISYYYHENTHLLKTITQDDNTTMSFGFNNINKQYYLTELLNGEAALNNHYQFKYTQGVTSIASSGAQLLDIYYDKQKNIARLDQAGLITKFTYYANGQLKTKQEPNLAITQFEYEPIFALKNKIISPAGLNTYYFYSNDNALLYKIIKENGNAAVMVKPTLSLYKSYFIYDDNFKNKDYCVLRFTITPQGKVTEYCYDNNGNVEEINSYLAEYYDTKQFNQSKPIQLKDLVLWGYKTRTQYPHQIQVIRFTYNDRGQAIEKFSYDKTDSKGDGVNTTTTGHVTKNYNALDGLIAQLTKLDEKNLITMNQELDSLNRITESILDDADSKIRQITLFNYQKNLKIIKNPNNKSEIITSDSRGLMIGKTEIISDKNVTRKTDYVLDSQNRTRIINFHDQGRQYLFYDVHDRLVYEVNELGYVTQYVFNDTLNYMQTIHYNNAVDVDLLESLPVLPQIPDLLSLLKTDAKNDSQESNVYNKSNQLIYKVDTENYLTYFEYDVLGKKVYEMKAANRLTNSQVDSLLENGKINVASSNKDRKHYYYYNKDNFKIAEIDPAGYLTEYRRDINGNVIETIRYHNIINNVNKLHFSTPEQTADDIHEYRFYNQRNELLYWVDGENYVTHYEYYANSAKKSEKRFANKLLKPVSSLQDIIKNLPSADPEDQVISYHYDNLGREVVRVLPHNVMLTKQYDEMNNIVNSTQLDLTDKSQQRTTLKRYDEWGQCIALCPPRIAQKIIAIDDNNHLSTVEKQKTKEQIWQTEAIRYQYTATGFKQKKLDELNNKTIYYSDKLQQERLVINALGAIVELEYDRAGNIISHYQYATLIPADQLINYSGGKLTSEIYQAIIKLRNPEKDKITRYEYDKRNNKLCEIVPEGNVKNYVYDAFQQCVQIELPVSDNKHKKLIVQEFDNRGLVTSKITLADKLQLTESFEYSHVLGKCTRHTLTNGASYQYRWDKIGRKIIAINPNGGCWQFMYDAFNRLQTKISPLKQMTHHIYNQIERSRLKCQYGTTQRILRQTKHIENAFGQVIKKIDAHGNSINYTYDADGKLNSLTDKLNFITCYKYNLAGWKIQKQRADDVLIQWNYDAAGRMREKCFDFLGDKLTTNITYDAFNNKIQIINSRNVITSYRYDKCDRVIQTVRDPDSCQLKGLNLITSTQYNADGSKRCLQYGDANEVNQRQITFDYDGLGRNHQHTLDPEGLKINTRKILDELGRTKVLYDPNGQPFYKFFDNAIDNPLLTVDANGWVIEHHYDLMNRVILSRHYAYGIDIKTLSPQTTITELKSMLTISEDDSLLYRFYDELGREKYLINSVGAITEKNYDNNNQIDKTIAYADAFPEIAALNKLTTQQVTEAITSLINNKQNRVTYYVRDAKQQMRFIFNAENYIAENRYDAKGRIITKIQYANPISNSGEIAQKSIAQILNAIKKSSQDRYTYNVFNASGKPIYKVLPNQSVIAYHYNKTNNLIKQVVYEQKVTATNSYSELVAQLKHLPLTSKARIKQIKRDNLERQIELIDELGYTENFKFDALDNKYSYVDKNNNEWLTKHDKAGRKISEATPELEVAYVTINKNKQNKLEFSTYKEKIINQYSYDNNGNIKKITAAKGTAEERKIEFDFLANNQQSAIYKYNVAIDDPQQSASLTSLPQIKAIVTQQKIYNAKGKVIVKYNQVIRQGKPEINNIKFLIYDSENRCCFKVWQDGGVVELRYNMFDELVTEILYEAPLTEIDFHQYLNSGLTISEITKLLPQNAKQRCFNYEYDNLGRQISKIDPQIVYCLPLENGSVIDKASPVVRQTFNAFGNIVKKAQLFNAKTNEWAETLYWYDNVDKQLARVNAEGYAVLFDYNNFAETELVTEYTQALTNIPNSEMTITQLKQQLQALANQDIVQTQYEYDNTGQVVAEIARDRVTQALSFDGKNIPDFHDLPASDLTKLTSYTPTGKVKEIIHEDNSSERFFYDARNLLKIKVDVTRDQQAKPNGSLVSLTPAIYYYHNVHGQEVVQIAAAESFVMNKPYTAHSDDRITICLMNSSGLTSIRQDPETNLKFYTYTPTEQPAREYFQLTNQAPVMRNGEVVSHTPIIQIAETRFTYNTRDKAIAVINLFDHQIIKSTYSQFNCLNESIGYGPSANTLACYQKHNPQGKVYATNANTGINTIILTDLIGNETLHATSAVIDLSKIDYANVYTLLTTTKDKGGWQDDLRIEQQQHGYNKARQLLLHKLPAYKPDAIAIPREIPLVIQTGKNYGDGQNYLTLTFPYPTASNRIPVSIQLWPVNNRDKIFNLSSILFKDNLCGSDINHLPTDQYAYHIEFEVYHNTTQTNVDVYTSDGILQINNGFNSASHNIVTYVDHKNLSTLRITGAINGLTAVALYIYSVVDNRPYYQYVANIELSYDANSHEYYCMLANYPSDTYVIKPIYGTVLKNFSLPFNIYTLKMPNHVSVLPINFDDNVLTIKAQNYFDGVNFTSNLTAAWSVAGPLSANKVKLNMKFKYQINDDGRSNYEISRQFIFEQNNQNKVKLLGWFVGIVSIECFIDFNNQWIPLTIANYTKRQDSVNDLVFACQIPPTLMVQGADISGQHTTMHFKNTNMDRLAVWQTKQPQAQVGSLLIYDISELHVGIYPFYIGNNNKIFYRFEISNGGLLSYSNFSRQAPSKLNLIEILDKPSEVVTPIFKFERDYRNKEISMTTPENNRTDKKYDKQGLLIKEIFPEISVIDNHRKAYTTRPTIQYAYNKRKQKIATRDANNSVTVWDKDTAGQIRRLIKADGTVSEFNVFSIFGNKVITYDAGNNPWQKKYTKNNIAQQEISPLAKVSYKHLNELNQPSFIVDNWNRITTFTYNGLKEVTGKILPLGQKTSITKIYDIQRTTITQSPYGSLKKIYDYFDNLQSEIDETGTTYQYQHDFNQQVTKSIAIGGYRGDYVEFHPYQRNQVDFSTAPKISVPLQHLEKIYVARRLVQMIDVTNNSLHQYSYDKELRTIESATWLTNDDVLLQHIHSHYNAVGWMDITFDTNATFIFGMDPVGNLITIDSYVYYQVENHHISTQPPVNILYKQDYSQFDRAYRILRTGDINAPTIYTYKNDLQISISFYDKDNNNNPTTLVHIDRTYDADSYLVQENWSDGTIAKRWQNGDEYGYQRGTAVNPTSHTNIRIKNNANYSQINSQQSDSSGIVTICETKRDSDTDLVVSKKINYTGYPTHRHRAYLESLTDYLIDSNIILNQQPLQQKESGMREAHYVYHKKKPWWRGSKRHDQILPSPYTTAQRFLNSNNLVFEITGASDQLSNGVIYYNSLNNPIVKIYPQGAKYLELRCYSAANGKIIASCAFTGDAGNRRWLSNNGLTPTNLQTFTNYLFDTKSATPPPAPPDGTMAMMDNSRSYRDIASIMYADPNLATQLSNNNNWTNLQPPAQGAQLTLPDLNQQPNLLNAHTHLAREDVIQQIIGSLYPHLMTPQFKPKHHQEWWLIAIEVVIVVAAAVATYGAGAAFGASLIGIIETSLATAAIGATSDLLIQLANMAAGEQQRLNLKSIAFSAISGLIQGSQPGLLNVIKNLVLTYAITEVEKQVVKISLGLQKGFDFRSLAEAVIISVFDNQIDQSEFNKLHPYAALALKQEINTGIYTAIYQQNINLTQQGLGLLKSSTSLFLENEIYNSPVNNAKNKTNSKSNLFQHKKDAWFKHKHNNGLINDNKKTGYLADSQYLEALYDSNVKPEDGWSWASYLQLAAKNFSKFGLGYNNTNQVDTPIKADDLMDLFTDDWKDNLKDTAKETFLKALESNLDYWHDKKFEGLNKIELQLTRQRNKLGNIFKYGAAKYPQWESHIQQKYKKFMANTRDQIHGLQAQKQNLINGYPATTSTGKVLNKLNSSKSINTLTKVVGVTGKGLKALDAAEDAKDFWDELEAIAATHDEKQRGALLLKDVAKLTGKGVNAAASRVESALISGGKFTIRTRLAWSAVAGAGLGLFFPTVNAGLEASTTKLVEQTALDLYSNHPTFANAVNNVADHIALGVEVVNKEVSNVVADVIEDTIMESIAASRVLTK